MGGILGIDSSSGACSAAILPADTGAGEIILARRFEPMVRGQAEALAPMIEAVLEEAGFLAADLDAIAVTVGPGAFTGLRIGLSAARALGLAAGVPVQGVTTFATVAAAVPEQDRSGHDLLSVIESRRDDHFVQLLDERAHALSEPAALDGAEIDGWLSQHVTGRPLLAVGDGAGRLLESGALRDRPVIKVDGDGLPDARWVAALVAAAASSDSNGYIVAPRPLYLRPPDVSRAASG